MSAQTKPVEGREAARLSAPDPREITVQELLARLRTVEVGLDAAKALYAERDALTLDLVKALGVGTHRDVLPDGTALILEDNFETKNVSWTSAPVRRYVAEFTDRVTLEKRAKRRAKKEKSE